MKRVPDIDVPSDLLAPPRCTIGNVGRHPSMEVKEMAPKGADRSPTDDEWMSDDPACVSCGHLRTDHPRDGRCGAALSERCWCQGWRGHQ